MTLQLSTALTADTAQEALRQAIAGQRLDHVVAQLATDADPDEVRRFLVQAGYPARSKLRAALAAGDAGPDPDERDPLHALGLTELADRYRRLEALLQGLDEEAKRAEVQAEIDALEAKLAKLRGTVRPDRTKTVGGNALYDPKAVRAWAKGAVLEVSSAGRVPQNVVDAYLKGRAGDRMTARPLAPEADLATVLHLAKAALQRGVMLDPEELLCQLYGLDEAQLLEHLEDDDPPQLLEHLEDDDPPCWECGRGTFASDHEEEKAPPAVVRDQSGLARARARDDARVAKWRQAEAGVRQHLVLTGRALCGSDDAGPWRFVSGTNLCPACSELEEVLGRHG